MITLFLLFSSLLGHVYSAEEIKCPEDTTLTDFVLSYSQERMQVCQKKIAGKFLKHGPEIIYYKDGTVKSKKNYQLDQEITSVKKEVLFEITKKTLQGHNPFSNGNKDPLWFIVWDFDLSPDGKLAASTARDMQIIIWDINSGLAVKKIEADRIENDQKSVCGGFKIKFTQDSKQIAVGYDQGIIKIYDIATGSSVRTIKLDEPDFTAQANFLQFNNEYLAVGDTNFVDVYDYTTGAFRFKSRVAGGLGDVIGADKTKNELYFLDYGVNFFTVQLSNSKIIATKKISIKNYYNAFLNPSGKSLIVVSEAKTMVSSARRVFKFEIWNPRENILSYKLDDVEGDSIFVRFSNNGNYFLVNNQFMSNRDCKVDIHDAENGKIIFSHNVNCKWAGRMQPSDNGHAFIYSTSDNQLEYVSYSQNGFSIP